MDLLEEDVGGEAPLVGNELIETTEGVLVEDADAGETMLEEDGTIEAEMTSQKPQPLDLRLLNKVQAAAEHLGTELDAVMSSMTTSLHSVCCSHLYRTWT